MVADSGHVGDCKKLKYPKAVFFITVTEFCERFSYYGMRALLALYLRNKLNQTDHTSTLIYHTFLTCVCVCPLFGAIIADSLLGRYRTIFYLSMVYIVGQLLISASAVPPLGLPVKECTILGLFLIAVGTGGIKPCVAALGGDQFILPQQKKYLESFFAVFYFTVHLGSLTSSFITPEIRNDIKCFGDQECYSLAFFTPTVLMLTCICIFVIGKPFYVIKNPKSNVVVDVTKCISRALYKRYKAGDNEKREHWLDYAEDKYDHKLISDIKGALRVLVLFIPLPFFWALIDQQGSRWTFQATRMDGEMGNFLWKADQVQLANPLFLLILIPTMETFVYPSLVKLGIVDTPLKKLAIGGFMAGIAFSIAGLLELKLETTYPILPTNGTAQMQIFNPRNCQLPIIINNQSIILEPFGIWSEKNLETTGIKYLPYTADFSQCGGVKSDSGAIAAFEARTTSYILGESSYYGYQDFCNKTRTGNPAIRVLVYSRINLNVTRIELSGVDFVFEINGTGATGVAEFHPGKYDVKINGKVVSDIVLRLGGVYTLQINIDIDETKVFLSIVTPPNSVHVLWILPQYIALTIAEVLFLITGVAFVFTEAPSSMKSLMQASWWLTVGFGNMIIVIISHAKLVDRQALEFFLYAGAVTIAMIIFSLMARNYEYRHSKHDDDYLEANEKMIPLQDKNSHPTPDDEENESSKLWLVDREVIH